MIDEQEKVLIVTVRLDDVSQQYFDILRAKYFPVERNFLKAHLTLFHKLPDSVETTTLISALSVAPFDMQMTGLINLGAGVAFRIEAEQLAFLRSQISDDFQEHLSPQDRQGFRGHITVQNKVTPEIARELLAELSKGFSPFQVRALGVDLWYYLGGPWQHKEYFPFTRAAGTF